MEIRKVFRAGNSLVVALPRDALRELGLEEGAPVAVEVDASKRRLVLRAVEIGEERVGGAGFARLVEDFLDKYERALKELGR
ncbi:MAG: hypothetical protein K6T75_10095 [Acetobacteraceae bacterium]|nr:hypothetical protein [Acetobacteraceae bacterium]